MTKRKITRVFVHCTGTRPSASVEGIRRGWQALGWHAPGYHFLVDRWGVVHTLLDMEQVANGVRGHNSHSVHVAYIGGIGDDGRPADTRTQAQRVSLRSTVRILLKDNPGSVALGHRDISPDRNRNGIVDPWERIKECPCFDVKTEL